MDTATGTGLFFRLPAELRNIIYRLLLTLKLAPHLRRLSITTSRAAGSSSKPPPYVCLNLLATCRQINTEASPILYAENTFIAHPNLLTNVPHLLDPGRPLRVPACARRIRRWYIHVRLDTDARFTVDEVQAAFSGAEELVVEASQAMYRAAGNGVLMLFTSVRGVGEAHVFGSVADSFARWLEKSMTRAKGVALEKYVEEGPLVSHHADWHPWAHGDR